MIREKLFRRTRIKSCWSGFTVIEILMAIAIGAILLGLVLTPFVRFRQKQILRSATEEVVSALTAARFSTLAAKNTSVHGVHFGQGEIVIFQGATYDPAAPGNKVVDLGPGVVISHLNLAGGASEVTFARLTGTASRPGSLAVALSSDAGASSTITISASGMISTNN